MSEVLIFSDPKIIAAVVGGISALIISLINNFWNSTKGKVEIEKMQAETKKLNMEMSVMKEDNENISNSFSYLSNTNEEIILYQSTKLSGFDIKFNQTKCFKNNAPYGVNAIGELKIQKGMISVDRANKEGRLEIVLSKYTIDGETTDYLPHNLSIPGDREIHLQFKVKSIKGQQTIRAVVKDKHENKWLAQVSKNITDNEWVPVDGYFRIPVDKDILIRIDNENALVFPTSYQIKEIRLTERKNANNSFQRTAVSVTKFCCRKIRAPYGSR